jgi:hypothetical protein
VEIKQEIAGEGLGSERLARVTGFPIKGRVLQTRSTKSEFRNKSKARISKCSKRIASLTVSEFPLGVSVIQIFGF